MILLTAAESRELDRLSQEKYGVDSYALMTRAGEAVASALAERFPDAIRTGVLVVCGKGNNGGDAMVAARRLLQGGVAVRVVLLGWGGDLKGDAARAHDELAGAGGVIVQSPDESDLEAAFGPRPGAVIDGVFGTGLNASVRGVARAAIARMNALGAPIVAVDIASGVDSDSGAIMGAAIAAALTVTFGYAKFGHLSYPGAAHCGELGIAEIGFAPEAIREIAPRGLFYEAADARAHLAPRAVDAHKGKFGHPIIIAGSRGKSGAAILASRAALRTGAGLVTAAIPESIQPIVAGAQPEMMTEAVAERDGHFAGATAAGTLAHLLLGKSAIVFGPGAGMNEDTIEILAWLLREGVAPARPMLIDADGLNALAALGAATAASAAGPLVMTPHPGEMARMLGSSAAEVNANRIGAARRLAELTGACVLLKGARSVIADATGRVIVNSSGNPGMATPGMGDALSGIIGALMAAKMAPFDALALGVFLHGHAADRVAKRLGAVGYIAGDVIDELPAARAALAG
ncbi:MAG TPA: NAD(P)H-hydrate dehydratase [Candidatus Binataceae bacterium]|nr:NAD(P)H-hydrate dehydratase [Candidatus Binataceae bacterium]